MNKKTGRFKNRKHLWLLAAFPRNPTNGTGCLRFYLNFFFSREKKKRIPGKKLFSNKDGWAAPACHFWRNLPHAFYSPKKPCAPPPTFKTASLKNDRKREVNNFSSRSTEDMKKKLKTLMIHVTDTSWLSSHHPLVVPLTHTKKCWLISFLSTIMALSKEFRAQARAFAALSFILGEWEHVCRRRRWQRQRRPFPAPEHIWNERGAKIHYLCIIKNLPKMFTTFRTFTITNGFFAWHWYIRHSEIN